MNEETDNRKPEAERRLAPVSLLGAGISLDPVNTDTAKILSKGNGSLPHVESLDEAMRIICDKVLCGYSVPLIINNLKAGATTTYRIVIKPTKSGTVQVELECEVSPMKRCILNLTRLTADEAPNDRTERRGPATLENPKPL